MGYMSREMERLKKPLVLSFTLLFLATAVGVALAGDTEGPQIEALEDEWSSTGYVMAVYPTHFTYTPGAWKDTYLAGDTARRWWTHFEVTNVASFPLTEAVVTIRVNRVNLWDGTYITDPAAIKTRVDILNSGDAWTGGYWDGWYVIHLGTIESGQTKKFLMNWWTDATVKNWVMRWAVWYLPSA